LLNQEFGRASRKRKLVSFKNCVKLVTGNTPDFDAIYRRLKEEMRPVLAAWLRE
jgi:hypothetical protein